jgi:hypothetical protein
MEEHYCSYHKQMEPIENFRASTKHKSWCAEGHREYNRKYHHEHYQPVAKPTHKDCTGCGKTFKVEEFPPRGDRPGKYHAKCYSCRKGQIKEHNQRYEFLYPEKNRERRKRYQQKHPGYGGGKSKVLSLQKVKRDPYTLDDIWGDGLCFFCQEPLDRSLKWPDPLSVSIHHIHPVSKRGPDVAQNAAPSHLYCNQSGSNKYVTPFADYRVEPLDSHIVRRIAEDFHYLKRKPNVSWGFGLFLGDEIMGIASFGTPSSHRISRSACPEEPKAVVEWNRLWIDDKAPFGAASWFGARALKQLPARIVVSYADLSQGHHGGVYRALSFRFAGLSKPRSEWRLPGSSRNSGKVEGAVKVEVPPRMRFWTVTGNKKEKAVLREMCAWPDLEYLSPDDYKNLLNVEK